MNFEPEIQGIVFKIKKILQETNTIVFAGPGISTDIGYPDWEQLASKLCRNINNINWINIDQLKKESPFIQSEVIKSYDKQAYYRRIFEIFRPQMEKNYSSNHLNLLKWPIKGIITTNFDNCFEDAYKKLKGKQAFSFSYYDNEKFAELTNLENKFIFHLHGHIHDSVANKIIFTKSDFEKLYNSDSYEQCKQWLGSLFPNFRFIFIGFSLNELDELNFPKWFPKMFRGYDFLHYALLPNSEICKSDPIKITGAYKVNPLYFPVVNNDVSSLKRIISRCSIKAMAPQNKYSIDKQHGLTPTKECNNEFKKKLPELSPNFVGRNKEISQIHDFIFSQEQKVLFIQGAAGIGKSSLITNSIDKINNEEFYSFYHLFVDNYGFIDFINEVCNEFIEQQYIYQDWFEKFKAFLSLYGDLPVVIVIDDFEQTLMNTNTIMIDEVLKFFKLIKTIESQIKVILISRAQPDYDFSPLTTIYLNLNDLGLKKIKLWLDYNKIELPENIIEEWYSTASGNLKLWEILLASEKKYTLSKTNHGETKLNQDKLLRRSINNLKEKSLELLEIFSAANTFIKDQVVCKLQESSKKYYEGINELLSNFLVKAKHADDSYEIHNIVKTNVYENMPLDKKQRAHSFLAESYFNTLKELKHDVTYFSYIREILDHSNKSSNLNLALNALELFFNDYPKNCDAKSILEFFNSNEDIINQTSDETKLNALLIKADYEANFGNLSNSVTLYETVLKGKYLINPIKKCEIILKLADINTKQRNIKDAEKYLVDAESILTRNPNIFLSARFNLFKGNWLRQKDCYLESKEYYLNNIKNSAVKNNKKTQATLAETYRAMANLNSHLLEYKQAKNNYKKAIEIFDKINEQMGLSTCFHSLASTFRKLGDYDQSINYFEKSIATKKNLCDIYGLARCHVGFSKTYRDMNKFEKALEHLKFAHKYKKDINDEEGIAIDFMISGTIYEQMEKYDQALENYNNSLKYFEKLNVKHRIGEVHHTMANLYEKRENLTSAIDEFEKAARYYDSINDNLRKGLCLFHSGSVYYKQGDFTNSLNKLKESVALLNNSKKYLPQVIYANIQLGFIYHKKNDYKSKAHYLKEVRELIKKENNPEIVNEVLNKCENILTNDNFKIIKKIVSE